MKPYDKSLSRLPKKPRRTTVRDILDMPAVQEINNLPLSGTGSPAAIEQFSERVNRQPTANPEGFLLALEFFVKRHGRVHGAKAVMARELGVSRAVVDSWDGVGIPRRHLENVSNKTGIAVNLLRPDPTK